MHDFILLCFWLGVVSWLVRGIQIQIRLKKQVQIEIEIHNVVWWCELVSEKEGGRCNDQISESSVLQQLKLKLKKLKLTFKQNPKLFTPNLQPGTPTIVRSNLSLLFCFHSSTNKSSSRVKAANAATRILFYPWNFKAQIQQDVIVRSWKCRIRNIWQLWQKKNM